MFVWGKNDLNPEQEKAIYNENSILLIACPGSGKTRTITYKIAYELSKLESNKQYIVAITYTNRAADEIKERIELLGVDTEQLWIGTIHSFCVEWILKPYHMYIEELRFGYDIINTNDTENYLVSLCASYSTPKKKITYWDCLCYCFKAEIDRSIGGKILRPYFFAVGFPAVGDGIADKQQLAWCFRQGLL